MGLKVLELPVWEVMVPQSGLVGSGTRILPPSLTAASIASSHWLWASHLPPPPRCHHL